jgi:hypothetical protein
MVSGDDSTGDDGTLHIYVYILSMCSDTAYIYTALLSLSVSHQFSGYMSLRPGEAVKFLIRVPTAADSPTKNSELPDGAIGIYFVARAT